MPDNRFSELPTRGIQVIDDRSEQLDRLLTEHFSQGNTRLFAERFSVSIRHASYLAFGEQSISGYIDLIQQFRAELARGISLEDLVIFVGQRRFDYRRNIFYSVVNAALRPSPEITDRQPHSVAVDWLRLIQEVGDIPFTDADGNPWPHQEIIGLNHIHPSGNPRFSPADLRELAKITDYCPGFVLGTVCPGRHKFLSTEIVGEYAYWDPGSQKIIKLNPENVRLTR